MLALLRTCSLQLECRLQPKCCNLQFAVKHTTKQHTKYHVTFLASPTHSLLCKMEQSFFTRSPTQGSDFVAFPGYWSLLQESHYMGLLIALQNCEAAHICVVISR